MECKTLEEFEKRLREAIKKPTIEKFSKFVLHYCPFPGQFYLA